METYLTFINLKCLITQLTSKECIAHCSDGVKTYGAIYLINSLASAWFRGFLEKKCLNARGFAREFLWSGMLYRPGSSLK